MASRPIIPIILCGGSGTRLWPLSRKSFPKQYLKLSNSNNNTLLQNTYKRISKIEGIKNPILICNEEHRFIAAEQMREMNIKPNKILLEPFGKNTAPAIALAALLSIQIEKDPILLVLSSDHEIKNNDKFVEVIKEGIKYANNDKIVTFGVVPHSPETGYGYIKADKEFNFSKIEGQNIDQFTEKPDRNKALEFIKDKRYTWNSGMFLFKAKKVLNEFNSFSLDIINSCKKSIKNSTIDMDFQRLSRADFDQCKNVSFDVAIMENTASGIVIPLDAGWNDIGSWESIWEDGKKDSNNNLIQGNSIFIEDTKDSYIRSEDKVIVGIGLENLVVVDTNDALLISDKNQTQKVKEMVNILKKKGISTGDKHQKIYRPWGHYLSVVEKSRWQVKLIYVKSRESLSLQMHHHRSEHWIIVDGTAQVEINGEINILTENESTYIPLGSKHRLSNPGKIPLILIEVQSGSYVGEDDIVRFEDKYGRYN